MKKKTKQKIIGNISTFIVIMFFVFLFSYLRVGLYQENLEREIQIKINNDYQRNFCLNRGYSEIIDTDYWDEFYCKNNTYLREARIRYLEGGTHPKGVDDVIVGGHFITD